MFNLSAVLNLTGVNTASVDSTMNQLNSRMRTTTRNAENLADAVALKGMSLVPYTIASAAILKMSEAISRATRDAIKFESEVAKIAQTLNISNRQAAQQTKFIAKLSRDFGLSAPKIAETARVLAQAGGEFSKVAKLQEAVAALSQSTLLASFDDLTETTDGLIAAMSQFDKQALSSAKIIGLVNTLSKKYAIEAGDLFEAVKKAGGAFSATGGKIEELFALFTTIRDTTRESAESISVGLRTITARLQRPATVNFFDKLGISLRDAEGKFIGTTQAIQTIQRAIVDKKIDPRSTIFAQIVEQLGGVLQQSRVIPLLTQSAKLTKVLAIQEAAEAEAAEDAAKQQETLAFKIAQTQQNIAALFREISESQGFKLLADSALGLTNALVELVRVGKDAIPLLALLGGASLAGSALKRTSGVGISKGAKLAAYGAGAAAYAFAGGFNSGGKIPGSGYGDKMQILAEPGEFMIKRTRAQEIGYPALHALNAGQIDLPGYMSGGVIGDDSEKQRKILDLRARIQKAEQIAQNKSFGVETRKEAEKKVAKLSAELTQLRGSQDRVRDTSGMLAPAVTKYDSQEDIKRREARRARAEAALLAEQATQTNTAVPPQQKLIGYTPLSTPAPQSVRSQAAAALQKQREAGVITDFERRFGFPGEEALRPERQATIARVEAEELAERKAREKAQKASGVKPPKKTRPDPIVFDYASLSQEEQNAIGVREQLAAAEARAYFSTPAGIQGPPTPAPKVQIDPIIDPASAALRENASKNKVSTDDIKSSGSSPVRPVDILEQRKQQEEAILAADRERQKAADRRRAQSIDNSPLNVGAKSIAELDSVPYSQPTAQTKPFVPAGPMPKISSSNTVLAGSLIPYDPPIGISRTTPTPPASPMRKLDVDGTVLSSEDYIVPNSAAIRPSRVKPANVVEEIRAQQANQAPVASTRLSEDELAERASRREQAAAKRRRDSQLNSQNDLSNTAAPQQAAKKQGFLSRLFSGKPTQDQLLDKAMSPTDPYSDLEGKKARSASVSTTTKATPSSGLGSGLKGAVGGVGGFALGTVVLTAISSLKEWTKELTTSKDGIQSFTGKAIDVGLSFSEIVAPMVAYSAAQKIAEKGLSGFVQNITRLVPKLAPRALLSGARGLATAGFGAVKGGAAAAAPLAAKGLGLGLGGLALFEGITSISRFVRGKKQGEEGGRDESFVLAVSKTLEARRQSQASTDRVNKAAADRGVSFEDRDTGLFSAMAKGLFGGDLESSSKRLIGQKSQEQLDQFIVRGEDGKVAGLTDEGRRIATRTDDGKYFEAFVNSLELTGKDATEFSLALSSVRPEIEEQVKLAREQAAGQRLMIAAEADSIRSLVGFSFAVKKVSDLSAFGDSASNIASGSFRVNASELGATGDDPRRIASVARQLGATEDAIKSIQSEGERKSVLQNAKVALANSNDPAAFEAFSDTLREIVDSDPTIRKDGIASENMGPEQLLAAAESVVEAQSSLKKEMIDSAKNFDRAFNQYIDSISKANEAQLSLNQALLEFGETNRSRAKEREGFSATGTTLSDIRNRRASIGQVGDGSALRAGLIETSARLTATGMGLNRDPQNAALQQTFAGLQVQQKAQMELLKQDNQLRSQLIDSIKEELALEQGRAKSFQDVNRALSGELGIDAQIQAQETARIANQAQAALDRGDVAGAQRAVSDSSLFGQNPETIKGLLKVSGREAIDQFSQQRGAALFGGGPLQRDAQFSAFGRTEQGTVLDANLLKRNQELGQNDAANIQAMSDNVLLLKDTANLFTQSISAMGGHMTAFSNEMRNIVASLNNASVKLTMAPANVVVSLNNAEGLAVFSKEMKKMVNEAIAQKFLEQQQGM